MSKIKLKRYDYEDTKYQDIDCEYVKYEDVKYYPEMLEALINLVSRPFSTKMSLAEWQKLYEKEITIIEKATNQKIEDLL